MARNPDVPLLTDGSLLTRPAHPRAGRVPNAEELRVRRILCPIDFSDFSRGTVSRATALARLFNAELRALFVFPPALKAGSSAASVEDVDPGVRSVVAKDLMDLLRPASVAGVPVQVTLAAGDPVVEILRAAHEAPADLIVMGTHGRSGVKRWALGAVTEHVLRDAPCPVLTCLSAGEGPAPGGSKTAGVLCAVGLSESSRGTVDHALLLAQAMGIPLTVLHVVALGGDGIAYTNRVAEARERLRQLPPERTPARIETTVLTGVPYREILRIAEEQNAGLIVVGNRGRHAPGRTLFGSTADQVARGATCPVLTVPPVAWDDRPRTGEGTAS